MLPKHVEEDKKYPFWQVVHVVSEEHHLQLLSQIRQSANVASKYPLSHAQAGGLFLYFPKHYVQLVLTIEHVKQLY